MAAHFVYCLVFMLMTPTGFTLVLVFFSTLPIAARLERLISIKTKIILNLIAIEKEVCESYLEKGEETAEKTESST